MSRVRFQLLYGPASALPHRMQASLAADGPADNREAPPGPGAGYWYAWRLIGANNRELGRSALSFVSYPVVRLAVMYLRTNAERLAPRTLVDPGTGRWGWRLDLDNAAVAVSGRWYERDHDSRLGMDKFITLVSTAELTDGVVSVQLRRGSLA